MDMDSRLRGLLDSINGNTESVSDMNFFRSEENHNNNSLDQNSIDQNPNFSGSSNSFADSSMTASSSNFSLQEDISPGEEYDFSDVVLKYITQMLMEEDIEEKNCMLQDCSALLATEKPFYEILGEKYYPPSPHHYNPESQRDNSARYHGGNNSSSSGTSSNNAAETSWAGALGEYQPLSHTRSVPSDYTFQMTPQSSFNPSNGSNSVIEGKVDSPGDKVQVHDVYSESDFIWQFRKGVEEANKFLPDDTNLIIDLESNSFLNDERNKEAGDVEVKLEKKDEKENSPTGSRGKKNLYREDTGLEEGRSNKQPAVFSEETVRSAMFDMVLLCGNEEKCDKEDSTPHKSLKTEATKNLQQNGQSKGSNGGKPRGRKQKSKGDVVDLRTLLIHCAQAVSADDRRTASELLRQIRQHSSPNGDGSQRLAHCFANGLEARLAGSGSEIYSTLLHKRTSAADILKAYHLFMGTVPFKKISNFFANQTIDDLADKATTLHIVDFGILYGFQWPCLIQRLSKRKGGPPKIRITGIELPEPGFRPSELVEETGRRLKSYAEKFHVPFEYHAIAQKWETIQLEDLNIAKDEVLVVNFLFRARNLLDETVILDSPRNAVLNLIRKMNPDVFIHGVSNGAYSSPFFVTRFREAFFHFSSLFDVLDTNIPREHPERILIERDILGKEALNIIACEGSQRVERPETYKQWQARNTRAGFVQLPLHKDIMKKAKERVKSDYHKDFIVDADSQWMLLGWKGRILFALSSWRPA
ncbi:scarecrow-like protein 14 [Papaver somniferum]|uniref:scarecrow-like protein 14 n=1 Tax=Papaver somniferum TaxID=3469 RepID=UPI000E7004E5|nr:scarecrow-like protein 14 [Papaver somniferum]